LNVKICPPASASSILESEPAFYRPAQPVGTAHFDAEGDAYTDTALSFSDFERMNVKVRKNYKREIPSWIYDGEKFREVIVRVVEHKAGFNNPRPGTPMERLERAEEKCLETREQKIRTLDNLCEWYVLTKMKGDPYAAKLAVQIEALDTQIMLLTRPAAIIAAILFLSYRVGLDSVGVSQTLGGRVKPPHVRQVLFRCRKIAGPTAACLSTRSGQRQNNGFPTGRSLQ
jgi:hypothetical protein